MEGKGRSRRRRGGREARRRISALLSVALTTAMTLNAPLGALGSGVMEAFASSSDARPATGSDAGSGTSAPDGGHAGPEDPGEGWMTAKNAEYVKGQAQDVDIYVIAEDTDVAPGNTSTMRLYLKNNTGSPITDGTLSFTGTRIKKEDGTFTDISGSGVSAEDTTVDDWGTDADMDPDELEALETEEYARDFGKDGDGQGLNKLTGLHLEPGQLHEIEFEFYTDDSVSAGKAYVNFKFQGEGADGKVRSSEKFYYSIGLPSVGIELLDGQALETGIEHELSIWMAAPSWGDYEIEEVQIPVKGTTAAETGAEEGTAPTEQGTADVIQDTEAQTGEAGTEPATEAEREPETEATEAEREPETEATGAQTGAAEAQTEGDTQVAVIIEDEPVPIQAEDSGEELTAGIILNERETVQAPLRRTADVGILETGVSAEGTTEETPEAASEEEEPVTTAPTEAPSPTTEPAAPAGQGTGGTQEGTAPTEATEETTAAVADPVDPTIESIPDTAPAVESTAPTESTMDKDAIKASEEAAAREAEQAAQQVQALAIKESKVSYTVEVFGTEFKRFRPKKTTEIEDIGWISCLYELAEDARPGVYYGKVTAKGKWNRRSFTTSQGFLFEITGEGTITLKGELDGTEVKVSGPASSFPEADKLELVVEALSQEEEEAVQEAIEKKDAPYATFSLSLLANGETADTTGPVTVKVGNRTIKESTAQLTAASEAKAAVAAQEAAAEPQAQAGTEATYTADDTADIATDITTDTTDSTTDAVTDDAEGEKAPVDTRKGPGADGKGFSGAALTADGGLAAAAEAKAAKETQEAVIAGSQEAGLSLMKIDTLAVEAEEVKADVTESGDLQTTTTEVMAIYAVTGLDEAHPVFIDSVTLADGVTVTVAAAEGVLPEGTTLSVEEVTTQVADIVKEDLEAKGKTGVSEVLAYDINLMVDGVKLENEYWNQDDKVKVTFSGEKIEEISQKADTVEIAPIETPVEEITGAKGGVAEVVKLEEITADNTQVLTDEIQTVQKAGDGAVSEFNIDAEHFTIYVVYGEKTNGKAIGYANRYVYDADGQYTFGTQKYSADGNGQLGMDFYASESGKKAAAVKLWKEGSPKSLDYDEVWYWDGNETTEPIQVKDFTVNGSSYNSNINYNGYSVTANLKNGEEKQYIGNESNFYWLMTFPEGKAKAYFYIFRPDLNIAALPGASEGEYDPGDWYYAGLGEIKDVIADKNGLYKKPQAIKEGDLLSVPALEQDQRIEAAEVTHTGYPDIVVDGKTYKYEGYGTTGLTYKIIWDNIVWTDGANYQAYKTNGDKDGNYYIVPSGKYMDCYHVNGYVSLSDRINVTFKIKYPGSNEFMGQEGKNWSQVISEGDCATEPQYGKEIAMDKWEGVKEFQPVIKGADGRNYYFDGWYKDDPECKPSNKIAAHPDAPHEKFDGPLKEKENVEYTEYVYYGRYIPEDEYKYHLTIHKTLEGLDESTDAYKSNVQNVTFELFKVEGDKETSMGVKSPSLVREGETEKIVDVSYDLSVGTYRLHEVRSANGYQLLSTDITFEIAVKKENDTPKVPIELELINLNTNTHTDFGMDQEEDKITSNSGVLNVTNHPGVILPDTGGPGLLQFNRFGWLLLLIALMMAGTEVRYFGAQKSRVEAEATEDRWPGSQGPDWM